MMNGDPIDSMAKGPPDWVIYRYMKENKGLGTKDT